MQDAIYLAESGLGLCDKAFYILAMGDIGFNIHDLRSQRLKLANPYLLLILQLRPAREHQPGLYFSCQILGKDESQSPGATGD